MTVAIENHKYGRNFISDTFPSIQCKKLGYALEELYDVLDYSFKNNFNPLWLG